MRRTDIVAHRRMARMESRRCAAAPCHGQLIVFQRAIPFGKIDVYFFDRDAMFARVAHDLRRRIKAHRLGIEQGAGEDIRIAAFDPGRSIDEQREGGRMAFGKAIGAEAFDLFESSVRRNRADNGAPTMPSTILVRKVSIMPTRLKVAMARRSLSASAGRESCGDDGDLHRLFLEKRNAECLAEHLFELLRGII